MNDVCRIQITRKAQISLLLTQSLGDGEVEIISQRAGGSVRYYQKRHACCHKSLNTYRRNLFVSISLELLEGPMDNDRTCWVDKRMTNG